MTALAAKLGFQAVRRLVLPTLLLALLAAAPAHAGHAAGGDLLPDLTPRPPVGLGIQVVDGRRLLRFGSSVRNAHTGPLELRPRAEDCDGDGDYGNDRSAYQRIYRDDDGNGVFSRAWERRAWSRFAGCMRFHPAHGHWHFESFTEYSLQGYEADGTLGPTLVTSGKVSFCVIDSARTYPILRGSPRLAYYGRVRRGCTPTGIWGISVGWTDYYGPRTPGQQLDVTGLPNGPYCLVTVADPENFLAESNERNNVRRIGIWLTGRGVEWWPYERC